MISEQRIIELAKESGYMETVYYDSDEYIFTPVELIAFANALQAECIKRLGEPYGYVSHDGLFVHYRNYLALEDNHKKLYPVKLYALPNEEK